MDPAKISELLQNHAGPLTIYARQWTKDPSDVVQQAFLQLLQQPETPQQPKAWLYSTVRNLAISGFRSESRRQRREQVVGATSKNWFEPSSADQIDAAAATLALQELPDEQREVVVCRIWGEMTFEEIAELMDVSSSTIHRWYQSGIQQIQEKMGIKCPNMNS